MKYGEKTLFRPFQKTFFDYTEQILSGAPIKDILIYAKPGAGKSNLCPIASRLIISEEFKGLWVVPRTSLARQGCMDFDSPLFDVQGKTIRMADNIGDPFRGCDYATVSYQAISASPKRWIEISRKYKLIMFLDEFDSLTDDSVWTQPIKIIWNNAFLRIAATGTINRSDLGKISFVPYRGDEIDFTDTDTRKWIIYDTNQALQDGSILPYDVHMIGGSGSYIDLSQIKRNFNRFTGKRDELLTGFKTEFAHQVFKIALDHWNKYKEDHPWSKFLVISHNIEIANSYHIWFREHGYNFGIATSEDDKQSDDAIARLRQPNNFPKSYQGIISVSKIYKGLNIPAATHLVYLTGVHGIAYVDQSIGRIQRNFPGKTKGFLFCTDNPKMRSVLKTLGSGIILNASGEPQKSGNPKKEPDGPARTIQALESQAHGFIEPDINPNIETQSDIEQNLRKEINSIINSYLAKQNPGNLKTKQRIIWLKIKGLVNKGYGDKGLIKKELREMTIRELKKVRNHVKALYA